VLNCSQILEKNYKSCYLLFLDIEFVTSPNNPDALLRESVLSPLSLCDLAGAIVNHAYYWPHFTHIPAAPDEDMRHDVHRLQAT
jgi:hypothetical protein